MTEKTITFDEIRNVEMLEAIVQTATDLDQSHLLFGERTVWNMVAMPVSG